MSPSTTAVAVGVLDDATLTFYRDAMELLDAGGLEYLVGGAYAFAQYTGVVRHTKDFDVFIRRGDFDRAKEIFDSAGYKLELSFRHWIGMAFKGHDFVDLILSAGNGVAEVDNLWFERAVPAIVFGRDVKLIPPEEMIWSKGLIMERERYDGADVAHLIGALGETFDWRHLVVRYGRFWRVLYAHLILFGFIFPSDRWKVPNWVMEMMAKRRAADTRRGEAYDKICYGTLLSRQQYLFDIEERGYKDARLEPLGTMSEEEIAKWTAGIAVDGAK